MRIVGVSLLPALLIRLRRDQTNGRIVNPLLALVIVLLDRFLFCVVSLFGFGHLMSPFTTNRRRMVDDRKP